MNPAVHAKARHLGSPSSKTWLDRREAEGLATKTISRDEWAINHLGPFFHRYRIDEIDVVTVDAYRDVKVQERNAITQRRADAAKTGDRSRERPLSNGSINAILRTLTTMLEDAVEYGYLATNPASGKRRRLKTTTPARPWEEPEQLPSLLGAASATGRLLLELLALAGLRIGEALALRSSCVDLGTGSLHVVDAKTPKGVREVTCRRSYARR